MHQLIKMRIPLNLFSYTYIYFQSLLNQHQDMYLPYVFHRTDKYGKVYHKNINDKLQLKIDLSRVLII